MIAVIQLKGRGLGALPRLRLHVHVNAVSHHCTKCGLELFAPPNSECKKFVCYECADWSAGVIAKHNRKALFDQCVFILRGHRVPSKFPVDSWPDLLTRPEFDKQPFGEAWGDSMNLIHVVAIGGGPEELGLFLQKWPDSVNDRTHVCFDLFFCSS